MRTTEHQLKPLTLDEHRTILVLSNNLITAAITNRTHRRRLIRPSISRFRAGICIINDVTKDTIELVKNNGMYVDGGHKEEECEQGEGHEGPRV